MSDIINENIFIEFINSQVKLSLEEEPNKQANTTSAKSEQKNFKTTKKTSQFQSIESSFNCATQNEYLIISAAKANVMQKLHKPVLKSQRLLDKTSWTGNLEAMQYFATLNYFNQAHDELISQADNDEDEYWLSDDIIDSSTAMPHSPKTTAFNNESFYDFDALSNSSDLSMNINENDITSSSSSTDLNKIYKNKVILFEIFFL